jgi:hypothetical protein
MAPTDPISPPRAAHVNPKTQTRCEKELSAQGGKDNFNDPSVRLSSSSCSFSHSTYTEKADVDSLLFRSAYWQVEAWQDDRKGCCRSVFFPATFLCYPPTPFPALTRFSSYLDSPPQLSLLLQAESRSPNTPRRASTPPSRSSPNTPLCPPGCPSPKPTLKLTSTPLASSARSSS